MAKSKMKLNYKRAKRERNKIKEDISLKKQTKSFLINLVSVILFIGVVYLGVLGLSALGAFEKGYTRPTKEETSISYEYILIGTVFNRSEKEYYVIFDDFEKDLHANISDIVSNKKLPVYKVDMSKSENALFKSEESNTKAKDASELKINDVTVIKFKDHKIAEYITGVENIEAKFK
jgi:hypothetical protein